MRVKLSSFFILFILLCIYLGFFEQVFILFISITLHEFGHVFAAWRLGIRVEEIVLFPFGSVAKTEDITKYGGYTEALIAIAGPAVSLVLALIFYFLSPVVPMLALAAKYNYYMFFFNLLPALPLDGGRIARNILISFLSFKQATKLMVTCARVLAILLILMDVIRLIHGEIHITYTLVGVFLYNAAGKELKFCSYYYLLSKNNSKKGRIGQKRIRTRTIRVNQNTYIRHIVSQFSPGNICVMQVVNEAGRVVYTLSEAEIMESFLLHGYESRIRDMKKNIL